MSEYRCYICGKYKNEYAFEYVRYLDRRLKKCRTCNNEIKKARAKEIKVERERKKNEYAKESNKSIQKYGVTPLVRERILKDCLVMAQERAESEVLPYLGKFQLLLYKFIGILGKVVASIWLGILLTGFF